MRTMGYLKPSCWIDNGSREKNKKSACEKRDNGWGDK